MFHVIILNRSGHRQVCQYQFKPNDIIWICKECQKDETCVLCNGLLIIIIITMISTIVILILINIMNFLLLIIIIIIINQCY